MSKFTLSLCFFCAIATCGVQSRAKEETSKANLWSVGATAGTLGPGVEASFLLYDMLVLRGNITYASLDNSTLSKIFTDAGQQADFQLQSLTAGVMLDVHPFRTGWRLSGGLRYVRLDADAVWSAGNIEMGNNDYDVARIGGLRASIRGHASAAPYVGFGYDSSHYSEKGVGFRLGFDLGLLYAGSPEIHLTPGDPAASETLAADIQEFLDSIDDNVRKYYKFYPVLMLSGRICF
jgi:hypothetical protein